jgi:hypothetical protein
MKRNNQSSSTSNCKKTKLEEESEESEEEKEEVEQLDGKIETENESEEEGDEEGDSEEELEGELDTIWLTYNEYHNDNLPILLNSTSTRKKTLENYVAPDNIRSTTYRSKDFPAGIWITPFGKLDPNDPRSGIYKCLTKKSKTEDEENTDSDPDASEEEQQELDSSSEDDWDAEIDDKEKLNVSESEKKAIVVENLKKNEIDTHFVFQQKSKQNQIRARMLMDATQILVEDWEKLKKKFKNQLTMKFESSLHCEVPAFEMVFTKKESPKPIKCNFDCKELILRCQCFDTFATLPEYVEHVKTSH